MTQQVHHPRAQRVVVITGASAGVGRAAALEFAATGARVALLARDPMALEDTRSQIEEHGGTALGIPVDVADAEAVFSAARQIEDTFGPIDVWVNNAMTTVFATVESLSPEEVRRVNDVTYLGTVHGTMAALRSMQARGRGTIIQVSSGLAYRPIPLQAAYCAAKHAARAFTEALRCELLHQGSAIRLGSVVLPGMNTPQFDWARTHQRHKPRPVAPVYQPDVAARAIVSAARRPQREYFVGYQTPLLTMGAALMPNVLDRYLASTAVSGQDSGIPAGPNRQHNLFAPVPGRHSTRGTFSDESGRDALVVSGSVARGLGVAALLGIGALVGACLSHRNQDRR